MVGSAAHRRYAFLKAAGIDEGVARTYGKSRRIKPMPEPFPPSRPQRGPPPAMKIIRNKSHHSANDPSSCRQTGLRHACPAASARRTAASSIVTPRPGASLRAMCPSTIRSGAGSAT